jgi:hypothetical protein
MGETTADGMFTLQQSECLGACADSPVMLVNDRTMCSFMSQRQARPADRRPARRGGQMMTRREQVLAQFQATGVQTCFHGRHINPQIYAGLNGSQLAPEGLRGARRLPGAAQDPGRRMAEP